ncbi:hypothetical protein [Arthrobacter luteolus]|uniref:hypothetical protein n=1 Tax=Arthrobacter luteolus TaxID=98672 RepID=UPI000833C105|nr:hypothetical protein [Arthrobacter luteolus]
MSDLTPETFDLGAWLTDAKLPEQSATVYQRADLIGELADLERRIRNEAEVAPGETPAGGSSLVQAYRKVVAQFEASKLTVYVQAIPDDRQQEIAESVGDPLPKDASPKDKQQRMHAIGSAVLAEAIIGMSAGTDTRKPVRLAPEQIGELEAKIGSAQMQAINTAWVRACKELPSVDADFLQKFSSPASGDA